MVVAAEGAGVDTALAVRLSVPSGSLMVSVERPGACAGPIEAPAVIASTRPIEPSAAVASTAIEGVAVVEGPAMRVVAVLIIDCIVVVPVESPPMMPAPTIPAEEANPETNTNRQLVPPPPPPSALLPSSPAHN